MKLIFLGYCSNSFSEINTVSFLLKHNDYYSIFDCGANTTTNLHKYVKNFSTVKNVFISHSHFDHFLGLPYFIIGRHLDVIARRKKEQDYVPEPLHIYLPEGLESIVNLLIEKCHSDVKKLSFELIFHTLCEGEIYNKDYVVNAFNVNHTVKTFGFTISINGEKLIGYSADTLYNDAIVNMLKGNKVLILEGMVPNEEIGFSTNSKHATFEQMCDVIKSTNPTKTFIVHLQPRYLSQRNEIINNLKQHLQGDVEFPTIGEEYEVLCL